MIADHIVPCKQHTVYTAAYSCRSRWYFRRNDIAIQIIYRADIDDGIRHSDVFLTVSARKQDSEAIQRSGRKLRRLCVLTDNPLYKRYDRSDLYGTAHGQL